MDTKNSELNDDGTSRRYKPVKPSDSMIKMLRSVVTTLQSMSECAQVCDNSDCGEIITFYGNQVRPIVCARCGKDIKWEGHTIAVGSCPICSNEYNINTYYCPLHYPPVLLIEKQYK
jgi:hypothetical protein